MRLRTVSTRARMVTWLSEMPSSFDFAGAAMMTGSITLSPRVTAICQRPLSPLGASTKARKVNWLPPACTWNGTTKVWRLASHMKRILAWSTLRLTRLPSSLSEMVPEPTSTWPCTTRGVPSAAISARMLVESGRSASTSSSLMRSARRMSRIATWRASMPTARTPSASGRMAALSAQARFGLSDSRRNITPPCAGRCRLALMRSKVQRLPLRLSSTIRLPFLRPSSPRSWPSRPLAPSASIQASTPAKFWKPARTRAWRQRRLGRRLGRRRCGLHRRGRRTRDRPLVGAGKHDHAAVGFDAHRHFRADQIEALRAHLAAKQPMPESPTSAFGALATMVPSASRTTTLSRRSEVRPFSSRSICVPPTVTVCLPPKFSSMAAFSQGVATSSSIGPCASRHHSVTTPTCAYEKDGGRDPQGAAHPAPPRQAAERAPRPGDAPAQELPPARIKLRLAARTRRMLRLGMVVAAGHSFIGHPLVARLTRRSEPAGG